MIFQHSKPIRKTDTSVHELIYEILGDKNQILGIDSYYMIKGKYYFLEFIKCIDKRPHQYNLNDNWNDIKEKIIPIWEFVCKAEGILLLICFEDSKEQFKIFKVSTMTEEKLEFDKQKNMNFKEFKDWFQKVNRAVLSQ